MSTNSNPLPINEFSALLPALAEQIESLVASEEPNVEEAAAAFRERLDEARALIRALPSGDLSLAELDELIEGLEELRDSKKDQLQLFAASKITETPSGTASLLEEEGLSSEQTSPLHADLTAVEES